VSVADAHTHTDGSLVRQVDAKAPLVAFIGRLAEQKGIDVIKDRCARPVAAIGRGVGQGLSWLR